jgi:predicted dehydrogenase
MEPSRLRIGVLGTGYWAWWCHGAAIQANPEVDLVGFWGRNPDNTTAAASKVGGRPFEDLDELLDAVDVVSIALPPQVQAQVAVRAADAGKHLLLDKPLALQLPAADHVVEAVDRAGVRSVSFMTFLFQPEVLAWLTQLREAASGSGPWDAVTVSLAGCIDAPGSPYATSVWRHESGGLWDWGPHGLALIREILSPVSTVHAARGNRDITHVLIEHQEGGTSSMTLSVSAAPLAQHATASVWGPAGLFTIELPLGDVHQAYGRAFKQLQESIRSGTSHPLDARYGRDTVAILDAVRRNLDRPPGVRTDVPSSGRTAPSDKYRAEETT